MKLTKDQRQAKKILKIAYKLADGIAGLDSLVNTDRDKVLAELSRTYSSDMTSKIINLLRVC